MAGVYEEGGVRGAEGDGHGIVRRRLDASPGDERNIIAKTPSTAPSRRSARGSWEMDPAGRSSELTTSRKRRAPDDLLDVRMSTRRKKQHSYAEDVDSDLDEPEHTRASSPRPRSARRHGSARRGGKGVEDQEEDLEVRGGEKEVYAALEAAQREELRPRRQRTQVQRYSPSASSDHFDSEEERRRGREKRYRASPSRGGHARHAVHLRHHKRHGKGGYRVNEHPTAREERVRRGSERRPAPAPKQAPSRRDRMLRRREGEEEEMVEEGKAGDAPPAADGSLRPRRNRQATQRFSPGSDQAEDEGEELGEEDAGEEPGEGSRCKGPATRSQQQEDEGEEEDEEEEGGEEEEGAELEEEEELLAAEGETYYPRRQRRQVQRYSPGIEEEDGEEEEEVEDDDEEVEAAAAAAAAEAAEQRKRERIERRERRGQEHGFHPMPQEEEGQDGQGLEVRRSARLQRAQEEEEEEEEEERRPRPRRARAETKRFSPRPEDFFGGREAAREAREKGKDAGRRGHNGSPGGRRRGSNSRRRGFTARDRYDRPTLRMGDSDSEFSSPEEEHYRRAAHMAPVPSLLTGVAPYPLQGSAPGGQGAAHAEDHRQMQPGAHGGTHGGSSAGAMQPPSAEITPVHVDPSISFADIGGLEHYVQTLKEMVYLPLMYPELFERFHVQPPRGVLLYGAAGTGKTLIARALAASAARSGTKVAFFMRKGADVLSKWVGEAERQLRLLFEEAARQQPSIIFFDEIDGLAPVRSSRQDQIHNSIVSTLLALMDGLDPRGRVVVLGATNRVDAIDNALRRPGRFDRELAFPLPHVEARASIIDIHTRQWAEPPAPELRSELAEECVGFCGADLKALCTEAMLQALRRSFPDIYTSEEKLEVDAAALRVSREDFSLAKASITPAAHRSATQHAQPLGPIVGPCLRGPLQEVVQRAVRMLPSVPLDAPTDRGGAPRPSTNPRRGSQHRVLSMADTGDEEATVIAALSCISTPFPRRPRLLITTEPGCGHGVFAAAVLHALEALPVYAIGLAALLADPGARSPEEALVTAVTEARRAAPALLYLPHLELWWEAASLSLRTVLCTLLADIHSGAPLLLLATAEVPQDQLDPEALAMFGPG
ncbi:hypothetical protein CYMTET_34523, partial [Cymbomonas tetramitiformis]